MTTALLTDHYELTMVQAALDAGTANRRSLFDLFTRRLPEGRRYGVVAGLGRALDAIDAFRFGDAELGFLLERGIIRENLADWLSDFRFTGDIWGYPEGEVYFPGSPVLSVEGTFAEACILETVLLSIYNHDSAIAAAGSRMTAMAGERSCAEMGSRRAGEWAAVAAARAAYITGFASTSNLEAGRTYGIPTIGTAAHSFTLLHDTEEEAFSAQIDSLGEDTTLLVDTYDVEAAIRKGIELTGGRLGAIRLDSGDLAIMARQARDLLDDLGATHTRIMVTSDLDEWQIALLQGAPVDGYGVGTSLVTGSGHPTCGFVYKLVARASSDEPDAALISVGKRSKGKNTLGGRKFAMRRRGEDGRAESEVIGLGAPPANDGNDRDLLIPIVTGGERVYSATLEDARRRHIDSLAELPLAARRISKGDPALETLILDETGTLTTNPYQAAPVVTNI
ncbi:nicotinate phosphoribosyltransferase [Tessaracoccus bendigoensis DSM 12906]|uniref:Nicotinate phosphoribosyltransferase n=1 Tax=Tessaracoccus bendigoensis DSM 12906 TaxID=1123357 RepID=A0A1M6H0P6_9ACTN|nr:nicotinate phosphoribosyltransferase [Tessaracoccus bendigoensis]SHJ15694.1 nicotinate phosphoribosyltransferase [Tessaracoccus bendigoensis DSM 12906]